jgi:uncharacterized protein DUF3300
MRKLALLVCGLVLLTGIGRPLRHGTFLPAATSAQSAAASPGKAATPGELDALLAPMALYPDSLLAQMLMCATDPAGLKALDQFLKSHPTLKGTELQDAALKDNFQPSFVALALFPQVVKQMTGQLDSTTRLGQAFETDRSAVFASIQRLRAQARAAGTLKTTPQQAVETQTTSTGQEVIVIEPTNPQVIYVPQYNAQTVYVAPTTTTTTVVVKDNSADAAVAGMVGFTAGIVIGAAVNNNYYYGPYGYHGGGYMYNDAWDDYYDHREDAREDWQDHREDLADERGDRAGNAQDQRTERQGNRQENRPESQTQRTERSGTTSAQTASTGTRTAGSGSYESRGQSEGRSQPSTQQQRSGTKSDAFSGYSSGKSERAASSRGNSSRSSSGSRGGGGRRR